jgi:hypothetical protein
VGDRRLEHLIQNSRSADVLVELQQWNDILARLALSDELEDQVAIYRHMWLIASGQAKQDFVTNEELEQWMAADEQIAA